MILVAARSSPLSQAQVKEVQALLPHLSLKAHLVTTHGDQAKHISLRTLDKTDFFTKEVDQLVLDGVCDIAVHSAKDLPSPLPEGLKIVAITHGQDSSDSLVIKEGHTLASLPAGSLILTSSERREEAVKELRGDLTFGDIRGTIQERLKKLEEPDVGGVVIAEAALIRLGLTHLNRITLPGTTTPYQGQLAIMARQEDRKMETLFGGLDTRPKKTLYLGLRCPDPAYYHRPIIEIVSLPCSLEKASQANTWLFTSITAIELFFKQYTDLYRPQKVLCTGETSKNFLKKYGLNAVSPENESAEGLLPLFGEDDKVFWPHSKLSCSLISEHLQNRLESAVLYTTETKNTRFSYEAFEELFFTSPSCVQAFLDIFGALPTNKKLITQGHVTKKFLQTKVESRLIE